MDKVVLLQGLRIDSCNIRTSRGNRARKDQTLPAGKYDVERYFTSTGPCTHGAEVAVIKHNNYTFFVNLFDVDHINARYKAEQYCQKHGLKFDAVSVGERYVNAHSDKEFFRFDLDTVLREVE